MTKYVCSICGYVYDEEVEGVKFSDLPDTWTCPICGAPKDAFEEQKETIVQEVKEEKKETVIEEDPEDLKELSYNQMSILCSNLAKGCEKQYKFEESKVLFKFADEFRNKAGEVKTSDLLEVEALLKDDIAFYEEAKKTATDAKDRGALRALVWSEKVSKMIASIINQYKTKGDSLLDGVSVYVCEICGFIYIGNELPKVCPVCKVPNFKMKKVEVK